MRTSAFTPVGCRLTFQFCTPFEQRHLFCPPKPAIPVDPLMVVPYLVRPYLWQHQGSGISQLFVETLSPRLLATHSIFCLVQVGSWSRIFWSWEIISLYLHQALAKQKHRKGKGERREREDFLLQEQDMSPTMATLPYSGSHQLDPQPPISFKSEISFKFFNPIGADPQLMIWTEPSGVWGRDKGMLGRGLLYRLAGNHMPWCSTQWFLIIEIPQASGWWPKMEFWLKLPESNQTP